MNENEIIKAIKGGIFLQRDIAEFYKQLILQYSNDINWTKINKAISKRWSKSGLVRIKEMAWRLLQRR